MRKFAATYAMQAGQEEQIVKIKLGFLERADVEEELCGTGSSLERSLRAARGNLCSQPSS